MMKKFIKMTTAAVLIFAFLLCGASCGGLTKKSAEDKSRAAKIGTYEASQALYNYFFTQYEKQYTGGHETENEADRAVLEEKIKEDIKASLLKIYAVYSKAAEHSIYPEDEDIKAALDVYIEQFRAENGLSDDDVFSDTLAGEGMTYEVFRFLSEKQVIEEALYTALCESGDIICSEDEVRVQFESGELIRVKHILAGFDEGEVTYKSIIDPQLLKETSSWKKAAEAESKLAAGADFDALIKEYGSDISLFGNEDGHYIVRGNKEEMYEQAAFSLEVGQVSGIVETSEGFCIIKRLPVEAEYVDGNISSLITSYTEGQFNIIIEKTAAGLDFEYIED